MKKISIDSYGKINLGLDVLFKREDGYHEINTIMQQIDLKDSLTIEDAGNDILIECNKKDLPLNQSNLIHKAWKKMVEKTGIKRGIKVTLDKKIPIAAGLGGGSSNAAAVLIGLNKLWELGFKEEELMDMGVEIGADVPFCIMGGTALARGIGEELTRLKAYKGKDLLLINPGIKVSTPQVYNSLRLEGTKRLDTDKIIESMEKDDFKALGNNLVNVMEEVVVEKNPIISEIKEDMIRGGTRASLMSGSGPTVFAFFDDREKLLYNKEILSRKYPKSTVLLAKTI